MKPNLFCTILACAAITSCAQQSSDDILEKFLSKDLLFRDECINNYHNYDCAIVRDALSRSHKYGLSIIYLNQNAKYLNTAYDNQINTQTKKGSSLFSLRNPKIDNIHQALIMKHVSEGILESQNFNEQLQGAAARLIIQSTDLQPDLDQNEEQLKLVGQSMENAFHNKNQNQ